MDVKPVVLPANTRVKYGVPGRFLMVVEAPSPVTIRFKRDFSTFREEATDVEAGYVSEPGDWQDPDDRFDALELFSSVAQTIRLGISDRRGDYRRVIGVVDITPPNDGGTIVDQTAGIAASVGIAANGNRRSVDVQNTSPDGTGNCRVGPGTVASDRGTQLRPGQSTRFQTTAAINIIREGGTDISVGFTEQTRT